MKSDPPTPPQGSTIFVPSAAPNPPPDPGIICKALAEEHPAWWKKLDGAYEAGPWLGWMEGSDEKTSWAAFVDRVGQGVLWYRDANGKMVGDCYGFVRSDLIVPPASPDR